MARTLLALPEEVRVGKEQELLSSLERLGLVSKDATLDDVLGLKVEDLLERRLQTMVMKKYNTSPNHARQLVVHKHVIIDDRIVNIPGYLVKRNEEDKISLRENLKVIE